MGIGTDTGPQLCGTHQFACSTTPVEVDLPDGVTATAIAVGGYHVCALTSAGGVLCWGWNSDGQLGAGTDDGPQLCGSLGSPTACSTTPVAVSGLDGGVVAISAGESHTCAVTGGGGVVCWGSDLSGQLGDGPTSEPELCGPGEIPCSTTPVAVSGLSSGVSAVGAGWSHSCALTTIGGVECWGLNRNGGLGTGDTAPSSIPVQVLGLPGAWTLSVSASGAGSGVVSSTPAGIDCGGAGHTICTAQFAAGSTVQVRASAGLGSVFEGFTGAGCAAGGTTCNVPMSADRAVTAAFGVAPAPPPVLPPPDGGPGAPEPEPEPEPEPRRERRTSAPSVSIRSGSALVANRRTKVRLGCRGGAAAGVCRGTLSLTARKRIVRSHRKTAYKTITVGRAHYAIPAGQTRRIGVQLSRAALRLLEHARRHQLRAKAIATVGGGRRADRAIVLQQNSAIRRSPADTV